MTNTEAGHSVQLIARTLNVLRALNAHPHSTLQELHAKTALPKATIHRILATLCLEGFVARDPQKSLYRLTSKVQTLSMGFVERASLAETGAPILRRLTNEIGWPLAIGTLMGTEIMVNYSTMPFTPMAVKASTVNNRHPLLRSAMGAAYLAHCDDDERHTLLESIRNTESDASALARDKAFVDRLITDTRMRGYGLRKPSPGSTSASIAVPIVLDDHVAGVICLTMFPRLLTRAALTKYPPILHQAADEIAAAMTGHAPGVDDFAQMPCASPRFYALAERSLSPR